MMKTIYGFMTSLILFAAISCKENEEIQPAPPTDGGKNPTKSFALSIKPSSTPAASVFTATISAVKEDGTSYYSDVNIALTLTDGVLVSNSIELPAGKYKLTKLLVKDEKKNVVIASPQANSAKAANATTALPIEFTEAPLTVESISVNETDLPEEYGYAANTFGETPYLKVKVKSIVYIAGTEYQPATKIKVSSGTWTAETENNTDLLIPKKLESIRFESSVWTLSSSRNVSIGDLKANPIVVLESSSTPRLIKEEIVNTHVPTGGTVVISKRLFTYTKEGQISKIRSYQKKTDSDELQLQDIFEFNYSNGKLALIQRLTGDGVIYDFTFIEFTGQYITAIREKIYDVETEAVFSYTSPNVIDALYTFNNGNRMTYTMKYADNNKVEDAAYGTGSETGKYTFDDQINPFYLIGYHDLFLSNSSKNNRLSQDKNYGGNIPSLELYKTEYSYDGKGYPELVVKSYRGFGSKEHLFKNHVEYSYYD